MTRDLIARLRSNTAVFSFPDRREAADEIERLRATDAKLPKTADGVTVVPGMKIYVRSERSRATPYFVAERISKTVVGCGRWPAIQRDVLPHHCYSTREAAEAARDA